MAGTEMPADKRPFSRAPWVVLYFSTGVVCRAQLTQQPVLIRLLVKNRGLLNLDSANLVRQRTFAVLNHDIIQARQAA